MPVSSSLYELLRVKDKSMPISKRKNPKMLIPVEVGSTTSAIPDNESVKDMQISFAERTLMKFFSIIL
jgi:hypothetical protein